MMSNVLSVVMNIMLFSIWPISASFLAGEMCAKAKVKSSWTATMLLMLSFSITGAAVSLIYILMEVVK